MSEIKNAKITKADLSMEDHGALCYYLTLEGNGWGVVYGGVEIGKGYLGAKDFSGFGKGTEAIMRIMDTVGVSKWSELNGKHIRVKVNGWGESVDEIGNIIEDKWFNQKHFFAHEKERGTNEN